MLGVILQVISGGERWLWDQIGMVVILLLGLYLLGREYLKLKEKYDKLVQDVIRIITLWENKWSLDTDADVEAKGLLKEIREMLFEILDRKK